MVKDEQGWVRIVKDDQILSRIGWSCMDDLRRSLFLKAGYVTNISKHATNMLQAYAMPLSICQA